MPEHFKSTEGRVKKPIISKKFQPIGQFVIDYLVVKPIQESEDIRQATSGPLSMMDKDINGWKQLDGDKIPINESQPNSNKKSKCNFKVTYAKHWKSNWKGLEVAHRGLGNSYTKAQK